MSNEALGAAEARFGFSFPGDYRKAVPQFGLVSPTIALLDPITFHDRIGARLREPATGLAVQTRTSEPEPNPLMKVLAERGRACPRGAPGIGRGEIPLDDTPTAFQLLEGARRISSRGRFTRGTYWRSRAWS